MKREPCIILKSVLNFRDSEPYSKYYKLWCYKKGVLLALSLYCVHDLLYLLTQRMKSTLGVQRLLAFPLFVW